MAQAENSDLMKRVHASRSKLAYLGVKSARYYFCLKYTEYKDDQNRLDNLWYAKITEVEFTKKLEAFTTFKEVEFN